MTATKPQKQSTSWLKRQEERKKLEANKKLERDIRDREEQEKQDKIAKIKQRKLLLKEKERLQQLSIKISQKKLARIKKPAFIRKKNEATSSHNMTIQIDNTT
ncbi:hypothetical protein PCASD_16131 [Puccinia coronata f. sp. avenae]|uniref:rRNA-processing protein n=1 Tax=Puccinia coronata f. sp. avenae TaxID=200324 RepID=A0A2N5SXY1_9BASI|nr:hypothetical protein PCASD_16131 [Puccinia coronata f. sp. avenae]